MLGLNSAQAAQALGNYWGPSIFGLLALTVIVIKVPTRPLLLTVLVIAIVLALILQSTSDSQWFLTVTLVLGFLTSCIFKFGICVGSQQVQNAPPILVTFLLCFATVGSTIAPAFFAYVVSIFGIGSAMIMLAIGFLLVALLIVICLFMEKQSESRVESEA